MAIVNCPECGKSVSEYAQACPECGYPVSAAYNKTQIQMLVQEINSQNPKSESFVQHNKKRMIMLIAIGLSSLLVIGVLFTCIMRSSSDASNIENETDPISHQESEEATSPQQKLITSVSQITDSQLICDTNGIKIWAMNMVLDKSYGEDNPYWVLTCYMENNSGHPLHTQFNSVDVNGGFGIDLRGINSEGNLSDGQKGIFRMHVAAENLAPYGIDKIESLSGLVWIIDSDTWDSVVDDEPFNILIDEIGNAYSIP